MPLVTLAEAKSHLRVTMTDEDADIESKVEQASAIVMDYMARPLNTVWTATMTGWTDVTVPLVVKAAVLRQLSDLYQFRGDDAGSDRDWTSEREGYLAPGVASLLRRYRDPVLA